MTTFRCSVQISAYSSAAVGAPAGPLTPARLASSVAAAARAVSARLRDAFQDLCTDDRTRYLSSATDLADLERRMRHWDNLPDRFVVPRWW